MEESTGRDAITSFISMSSNDASSSRIDKSKMSPFNRLLVDADRIKKEVKQLQKKRFSFSHDSCDGIQNENKGISSGFSGIISEVRKLQKERFNHKDAVSDSVRIVEIVAIEDEELQQRFSKNEDKVRLFNDVMKSAKSFKAALPLDKIRTTTSECVENVRRPSLLNNVESVIPEFKSNKDYDIERLRRSNCEETLKIQPDDTSLINYRSPLSKRRKTEKVDSTNVDKSPISQSITDCTIKSNVSLPLEIECNKHMNPPCSFKIERHQKLQSEKCVAEVSGERCKKDNTSKSIAKESCISMLNDKQDVHLQNLGMDTNKKRHSLSNTIEFLINRHRDQQGCVTSNENNTVMDLRDTFSNKECISEIEVKKKKVPCITSESRELKQNTTVLDRNSLNVKDKSFDQESLTKVPVPSNFAATVQNKDHLIQTFKLKDSKKFAKICSNNDIERYLSILCSDGNISISRRTSLNNDQCPTNQDTCNITEIVNKELKLTSTVTSPDRLTNCHIPSEVSVSLIQPPADKGSVQHGSKIYGSTTSPSSTQVIKSVLMNKETYISPSITHEANKKEIESVQTNILVPSCDVQETKHNTTCKSKKNIVTTVQNVEAKPSYTSLTHSEISVMAIRQSCSPLEINITEELDVPAGLRQHVPLIDLSESAVMPCGKETNDGTVESKLIKCSHSGENKTVSERPEITHTSAPSISSLSQNLPSTSSMDSESQNFKLSYSVSQNPNKFSPKGKVNGFDILMGRQKTPQKKTPSKRLGKNSPVKLMLKNKSPKNFKYRSASPNKSSPFKKLNFDETNGKHTPQSRQATESENSPFIAYSNEFVTYFECILDNILKDNEMSVIIQKESEDIIAFKNLEDFQSKKLYIRMLGRKYTWHRVSDIKYDDIGIDDINSAFSYLEAFGFVTSDYSSEKVEVLLQMLKKPELQSLCKIFRIQPISLPKQKLIDALLNYRHQPTVFGSSNSSSLLLNRLRENLRHCIKLCEDKRQSFLRVVLLFSLPHQDIDEDREVSRQLIMLHYVKTNRVQFPSFAILKTIPVFSTKEELNCFEEANELLAELTKATDAKNWCDAQKCGEKASAQLEKVLNDSFISSRAAELPLFLRRFTGGSTYAYVMHRAIEACKKRKESIPFGVNMLVQLLGQNIYLPQYRGNWYEQLALLQQQHFKNPVQAAETVIVAMNDDHLNEVQQQVISGRGSMLLSRKKQINKSLKLRLEESIKEPLVEPPNITIKAKALQTTAPGYKKIYIQEETEEVTYSSVEEYVVSHYKSRGYTEGVHAEGSIIITLFGLIFWDIIYEYPVPDVFRCQYQREPLDLCSGEFYKNRKEAIDERLIDLCNWEMDYLKNHILSILQCHEGQESLVNWQRFKDLNQIMGFIECVGVEVLSRILERVVKSFRSVRKGFPDLAVWNPNKKECKFVEVKGPNDRLSIPQKLWLNYLTKCNIQCAEVCYVETTGSKQIQRNKRARPICEEDL